MRTSRGVTYTIEFVRFQAGRNFAELRWDGDSRTGCQSLATPLEIETETVREGRNAPIAEVQTISVQAKTGSVPVAGRRLSDATTSTDVDLRPEPDADLGIQREDDIAAVRSDYDATCR